MSVDREEQGREKGSDAEPVPTDQQTRQWPDQKPIPGETPADHAVVAQQIDRGVWSEERQRNDMTGQHHAADETTD